MTGPQLVRFSGLTVMVGGAVSFLQILFSSLAYSGNDPTPYVKNPVWAATQLIGVAAVLLVVVGIPGVYASRADRTGLMGLIGLVSIAITGLMFPFFFGLVSVMIFPWLVDKAPALVSGNNSGPPAFFIFFIAGSVIQVVGTALLAILFIRGRLLPRWIGFVFAASAILAVVGFFLSGPNGPSNILINLISNLGPVLLLAGLSYIGYQTWSAARAAPSLATQAEVPVTT
jgi:hypothetical protein